MKENFKEMIKDTPDFMRERTFEIISKMQKKWFNFDLELNLNSLSNKKNIKILDVGGGKGIFARTLKENYREKVGKSINCDFYPEKQDGVENISENFFKCYLENNFDYINAMASIDYMPDSILAIEKIANSLEINGFSTMYFMKKQSLVAENFDEIISQLKEDNSYFEINIHEYDNRKKPDKAFYNDGILLVIKRIDEGKFVNNYKLEKTEKGLVLDNDEDIEETKKYRTFEPHVIRKFYNKKN